MSKVDAQRAMRAARLARTAVAPAGGPAAPDRTAARAGATAPDPTTPRAGAAPSPAGAPTCGHRNMAGKECVRPSGHSEKSHRYS